MTDNYVVLSPATDLHICQVMYNEMCEHCPIIKRFLDLLTSNTVADMTGIRLSTLKQRTINWNRANPKQHQQWKTSLFTEDSINDTFNITSATVYIYVHSCSDEGTCRYTQSTCSTYNENLSTVVSLHCQTKGVNHRNHIHFIYMKLTGILVTPVSRLYSHNKTSAELQ